MKYKLTFIYCLIVLILSVLPSSSFPKTEITNIDKIVHFLMYFLMVGVMFLDDLLAKNARHFDQREKSRANKNRFLPLVEMTEKKLLYFFFFSIIFGAIIEIIQHFLPSRSAEWYDLLSNSLGAGCAIITIYVLYSIFLKKNKKN